MFPHAATPAIATGDKRVDDWWRSAVVYQVYIRSFADGDGDGIGDIAGIRAQLRTPARARRRRGVDQPVVPVAHGRRGLRRRGLPGDRARVRHAGRGASADRRGARRWACACCWTSCPTTPPTSTPGSRPRWRGDPARRGRGTCSGPAAGRRRAAAQRLAERLRRPGLDPGRPTVQWYLHLFDPGQPDLDWTNPEVRAEFETVLRFWFDQGVDGFRIDVAHGLVKDPGPARRRADAAARARPPTAPTTRSGTGTSVHEIYRAGGGWPTPTPAPRVFVAEAWVRANERLARYLRPDELHTAFNFHFLHAPWDAEALRARDRRVARPTRRSARPPPGCCPTTTSSGTSPGCGRADTRRADGTRSRLPPTATFDRALGRRRARAAALLHARAARQRLRVPGRGARASGRSRTCPTSVLQDPTWRPVRAHRARAGRLPRAAAVVAARAARTGSRPARPHASPGCRSPRPGRRVTVEAQQDDPGRCCRCTGVRWRCAPVRLSANDSPVEWIEPRDGVLAFARGDRVLGEHRPDWSRCPRTCGSCSPPTTPPTPGPAPGHPVRATGGQSTMRGLRGRSPESSAAPPPRRHRPRRQQPRRAIACLGAAISVAMAVSGCGGVSGPPSSPGTSTPTTAARRRCASSARTPRTAPTRSTSDPAERGRPSTRAARPPARRQGLVDRHDEPRPPFHRRVRQRRLPAARSPTGRRTALTDGMSPAPLKTGTWKDKLVAAPFWANTQLLWYRKSVAEAAGVDPTSARFTWDQIIEAAAATGQEDRRPGRAATRATWCGSTRWSPPAAGRSSSDAEAGADATPSHGVAGRRRGRRDHRQPRAARRRHRPTVDRGEEEARVAVPGRRRLVHGQLAVRLRRRAPARRGRHARPVGGRRHRLGPLPAGRRGPAERAAARRHQPRASAPSAKHPDQASRRSKCITSLENNASTCSTTGNPAAVRRVPTTTRRCVRPSRWPTSSVTPSPSAGPRPLTPYYGDVVGSVQQHLAPAGVGDRRDAEPRPTPSCGRASGRRLL